MPRCTDKASGDGLLTAAAALSIAISKGKTLEELEVLSAFFTVLGDSLALLALHLPQNDA